MSTGTLLLVGAVLWAMGGAGKSSSPAKPEQPAPPPSSNNSGSPSSVVAEISKSLKTLVNDWLLDTK